MHVVQTKGRTPLTVKGRPFVLIIAFAVVALDQITKALAVALIDQPINIVGSLLRLNLIRNPGAAFGLGTSTTYVFTAIAAIAVFAMVRYVGGVTERSMLVIWGLILGGASGNLIDRLTRSPGFPSGHVVDFIEIPYWPIFNVADSSIFVAVVLGIFFSLRKSS